jgi:hypothetical protein
MGPKVTTQRITSVLILVGLGVGCGGSDQATGSATGETPIAPTGAAGGAAAAVQTPVTVGAATPTPAVTPPPAATPVLTPPPAAIPAPAVTPPAAAPAVPPAAVPVAPGTAQMPGTPGAPVLAMDECGLKTSWQGDEYCINPPAADKGFQMHIGPSNYDNPESQYILQPGGEVTESWPATSGNTSDVYFYWRQYRMRPGSHHLIITAGDALGAGRRLGGSSNLAKDNPEGGVIAPENEGIGMPLSAKTAISNSLHYFNFTDKPIIKEVWVNFWYRDKSEVTQPTIEVFSMLGMGIPPGEHIIKHGSCPITQAGRLLTTYGHVHSHDKRFSVWRMRAGQKTLVHEAYNWQDPNVSEFSSTVMNPMLDPADKKDGGYSGVLDLAVGDSVEFECDIVNDTNLTFVGQNEAMNDEMCIMIGDSVGSTVPGLCTSTDVQPTAND